MSFCVSCLRNSTQIESLHWSHEVAIVTATVALLALSGVAIAFGYLWPSIVGFSVGGLFAISEISYRARMCRRPSEGPPPDVIASSQASNFLAPEFLYEVREEYTPITTPPLSVADLEDHRDIAVASSILSQQREPQPPYLRGRATLIDPESVAAASIVNTEDYLENPVGLRGARIPITPLKDRISPLDQPRKQRVRYQTTEYSLQGVPALRKMAYQIDRAVREGANEEETVYSKQFRIDLRTDVSNFVDHTIHNPGIGVAESIGLRRDMEDVHFIQTLNLNINGIHTPITLAAVCDGHGDTKIIGELLRDSLSKVLEGRVDEIRYSFVTGERHFGRAGEYDWLTAEEKDELRGLALTALDEETITTTVTKALVVLDRIIVEKRGKYVAPWAGLNQLLTPDHDGPLLPYGGTTMTALLMLPGGRFMTINVGDSRTILCKDVETVIQLTKDHKPSDCENSIKKEGHHVSQDRVNGMLACGRDIGMGIVSARPNFTLVRKSSDPDDFERMEIHCAEGHYFVLACDGLFDFATNASVAGAIAEMDAAGKTPAEMAGHLVQASVRNQSRVHAADTIFPKRADNVTVMVVKAP